MKPVWLLAGMSKSAASAYQTNNWPAYDKALNRIVSATNLPKRRDGERWN